MQAQGYKKSMKSAVSLLLFVIAIYHLVGAHDSEEDCITAEQHISIVSTIIDGGEKRLRYWMGILVCTFCCGICIVYWILQGDVTRAQKRIEKLMGERDSLRAELKGLKDKVVTPSEKRD